MTGSPDPRALRVAAVIPCFNEALSIAHVVDEFRAVLDKFYNGEQDPVTIELLAR